MQWQRMIRAGWIVLASAWLATGMQAANAAEESQVTPNSVQSGSLLFRMQNGYRVATRMNSSQSGRHSSAASRAGGCRGAIRSARVRPISSIRSGFSTATRPAIAKS